MSKEQSDLARTSVFASGVPATIHDADYIFRFLAAHELYQGEGTALRQYLKTGRESADHFRDLLTEFGVPATASILEFASGYGCVTRHLLDLLPLAEIVPCDIHPEALNFIKDLLGISGRLSNTVPECACFGGVFDVIFALSFFSHMPKKTWSRWLRKLAESTKPGGLIIFTTHGWKSWEMMSCPKLEEGFWFTPSSEQADLDTSDYGTTITLLSFSYANISSIPDVRLIKFREGFWWGHQDLYVLQRNARADSGQVRA